MKSIKKLIKKSLLLIKVIFNTIFIVSILYGLSIMVPKGFGIEPNIVLSGSMEPQIQTGGLVWINTKDKNISIDDVVTYKLQKYQITHRVVKIEDGGYVTKGDANDAPDNGLVHPEQLVGKVIFTVPYLGYVTNILSTKAGIFALASVLAMSLILDILIDDEPQKEPDDHEEEPAKRKYQKLNPHYFT